MQSKWSQLDIPVRVSTIFGFVMGIVQLFFAAPLYGIWLFLFNPIILQASPDSLFWLGIILLLTLSPLFLLAGSVTLIVRTLSKESQGILGFLLFLGGALPTVLLLFFYALSLS